MWRSTLVRAELWDPVLGLSSGWNRLPASQHYLESKMDSGRSRTPRQTLFLSFLSTH